jgi:hypothetical protein
MIREINLKTGKQIEREYTEEEISKRDKAILENAKTSKKDRILNKLTELDIRSIRAIREGDAKRIQELELQAEKLRTELRKL